MAEPIEREEFARCQERKGDEIGKLHEKLETVKDNLLTRHLDDKKDLEMKMENSVKKVESSMNRLTLRVTVILLLAIFIQITVLFLKTGGTQNVQKIISHNDTTHFSRHEYGSNVVGR